MEYFVDSTKNTELLQIKCDVCEGCYADQSSYITYEEYKSALETCKTCSDCKKHGNCQTTLWEGTAGSLFMDFISLDFDSLNNQILKIVERTFNDFKTPIKLDSLNWWEKLADKIDYFLTAQHFLFRYCSVGNDIALQLSDFNFCKEHDDSSEEMQNYLMSGGNKIEAASFPELINKTNFRDYKCIQSILNESIENKKFYSMIVSKNSPLIYFGFDYMPISKNNEINDLKFRSLSSKAIDENNIVEKIIAASQSSVYKEPNINEYYLEDTAGLIAASFSTMLDLKIPFRKCKNCGKYFIPESKANTKYCLRTSPQYPKLTCRDAAKYIKQLEREKNNKTEKMRKSIYNTLRNRLNSKKALENEIVSKQCQVDLKGFIEQSVQWKSNVKLGINTEKQYIKWLSSFKKK